jgi:hypothetical protein
MNKLLYQIINYRMPNGNPANHKAESIFNEINSVLYDPLNPEYWHIMDKANWGSAPPDNIGVHSLNMVTLDSDKMTLCCETYPEGLYGKDYAGNTTEKRYYRNGLAVSTYHVSIGQSISILANVSTEKGCCPAIWLFPWFNTSEEEKLFYKNNYRELDLLESYPKSTKELNYILQSVHFGSPGNRKLLNKSFHKLDVFSEKVLFTIDLKKDKFVFKINGITTGIYRPGNDQWKSMNLVLGEAVVKYRMTWSEEDISVQKTLGKMIIHGIKITD